MPALRDGVRNAIASDPSLESRWRDAWTKYLVVFDRLAKTGLIPGGSRRPNPIPSLDDVRALQMVLFLIGWVAFAPMAGGSTPVATLAPRRFVILATEERDAVERVVEILAMDELCQPRNNVRFVVVDGSTYSDAQQSRWRHDVRMLTRDANDPSKQFPGGVHLGYLFNLKASDILANVQPVGLVRAVVASQTASGYSFRRTAGKTFAIRFGDESGTFRDLVGFEIIGKLFRDSGDGRPIEATVLHGLPAGLRDVASDQPRLDAQAHREYGDRLAMLATEKTAAANRGDDAGVARIEGEIEQITNEVKAATSLGGRDRTLNGGDRAKSAETAVRNSYKRALADIRAQMPRLGTHLDRCVTTGQQVSYANDGNFRWDVEL